MDRYFYHIYLFILVICIIALFWNRKNYREIFPYFFSLLLIVLLVESARFLPGELRSINFHYPYSMLELTLLGMAYRVKLKSPYIKKYLPRYVILSWIVFFIFSLTNGMEYAESLSTFLSHSFLVLLSIFYFYEAYKLPYSKVSLLKDVFFWVNCANLFFYVGAFLHMSVELSDFARKEQFILFYLSTVFNLTLYTVYAISFSCLKTTR